MSASRAYRARGRAAPSRSERTRERITAAVRALLEEGAFHDSTVEQVAQRAGVSRATLYQHFRSRLDLVDAICDTFDVNPALVELRRAVELPDPDAALRETVVLAVRFWATEDAVLRELYGVVAIDLAARELVDRQRADRRGEMQRLARHLWRSGRLREGVSERAALDALMLLTSYDAFRELCAAGRSERQIARALQDSACALLLPSP
ncbi:MAG TPA: helix-turn-helix domain-containing protein [Conexibacter sp.]|nr:helix-turn-helix domain-containing protein [Conexibacter sp.]